MLCWAIWPRFGKPIWTYKRLIWFASEFSSTVRIIVRCNLVFRRKSTVLNEYTHCTRGISLTTSLIWIVDPINFPQSECLMVWLIIGIQRWEKSSWQLGRSNMLASSPCACTLVKNVTKLFNLFMLRPLKVQNSSRILLTIVIDLSSTFHKMIMSSAKARWLSTRMTPELNTSRLPCSISLYRVEHLENHGKQHKW